MVGPGAARRQRVPQVERREAQRPTSLGACAPQAVTLGNQEWPWAHGWPDRKGCPKGAVAQRPGASRRSIPLVGKRKKGNRRSRRLDTTGDDACLLAYPTPERAGIKKNPELLCRHLFGYIHALSGRGEAPFKAAILDAPGTGGSVFPPPPSQSPS